MQFMTLFSWHPDKAETPAPADLRKAEFEMIRGLYAAGLVRQIWHRGNAGGACAIVEAASTDEVAEKFNALPLVREGYLQPPMIVPLKPYSGFAPASEGSRQERNNDQTQYSHGASKRFDI
jgi:muconolactone delta-isomerase